jgi:histidyl-tRNA synthetase
MKRGEKLKLTEAKSEADLVDSGLSYDLTLPLSRFYANNANDLPSPVQGASDGKCMAGGPPSERQIPPVHAV